MLRSRSIRLLLVLLIVDCNRNPDSSIVAVTGATVIDVRDGSHSTDAVILVDSGRIIAVGSAPDIHVPSGARVIDARGKYVIPGLWDMHTHIQNQRELDVFFPLLVAHGIVGIRDVSGLFPSEFREYGGKHLYRPRVVASGPGINGAAPAGVADAAIVDELAAKGVDFIKVFSMVPRDRFLAIVARAKARGLHVAGHIPVAVSALEASDVGLRTMEHFDEILLNVSSRETDLRAARLKKLGRLPDFVDRVWEQAFPPIEPFLSTWSDAKAATLFGSFVRNGTWQAPTLELYRLWSMALFDDPAYWSGANLALIPQDWRQSWRGDHNKFLAGKTPAERAVLLSRTKVWYRSQLDVTRRMHDARVQFLAGTDVSQWNFMVPGLSLHDELLRLVEAGLSPLEALQAATINPAKYLAMHDAGVVAPGKRADLLILDADPTVDIQNTRRISVVVLGGQVIERHDLDEMLDAARKLARMVPPQ